MPDTDTPPALLLSRDEVGALLGVTGTTVKRLTDPERRAAEDDPFPAPVKVWSGARLRWRRADVEEWLARRPPAR